MLRLRSAFNSKRMNSATYPLNSNILIKVRTETGEKINFWNASLMKKAGENMFLQLVSLQMTRMEMERITTLYTALEY